MNNRHKFSKHFNMFFKLLFSALEFGLTFSSTLSISNTPNTQRKALISSSFLILSKIAIDLLSQQFAFLFPTYSENNISSVSAWNDEATSPSGKILE